MAWNTLLDKPLSACEAATVEELDYWVQQIYTGAATRAIALLRYISRRERNQVHFEKLHHLWIIGDYDKNHLANFESIGISRGFYLSKDATWLLLILPEKPDLGEYLSGCSDLAESLMIWNSSMYSRDVGKLPGLKQLYLNNNPLLEDFERLADLKHLEELRIYNSPKLTELPGLDKLTQLTRLNLSHCRSLTELNGLDKLTQLTQLDLFGCSRLTELNGLEKLTKLTYLDLSGCSSLTELPDGIRHLRSLRLLDLSEMHLKELPDWLPEIAEAFTLYWFIESGKQKAIVSLEGTTVEGVDMSIFEQPYEMVVKWFEERKLGRSQPLNEIKVVFLGDGEAGKSHTIARLMNDGGDPDPLVFDGQSTPGIVIRNKEYDLGDRKIQVHYWDFGGQEIMHSMHRIFLTNRTMYVVLLNARDDTQGDRAHYWLQNIQSFAPEAPVLLVLNKIDQNPKASVDERTLKAKYPGLTEIVRLSALEFDRERFNREFTDVLLKEIRKCSCLDAQWPQSWIRVKNKLENMHRHYILGNEYSQICRECQAEDVQRDLLYWFNDLGVSFCFCDKEDYALKKHVILRPDWITNGLYIILFNECEGASNGVIPHRAIYELLERASHDKSIRCTLPDASYDRPGDVEYVLGVMRKFQISLDAGDRREFIPMLCQQDSTLDIHYYEKDAETLEFHMEFKYLPDNLLHRLMVERHAELDMSNVWRRGARFQLSGTGLSAVVVIDGNTLKFFIRRTDPLHRPNTYLTMLKASVDRIVEKMNLEAPQSQLVYKLDEKREFFDYDELKVMIEVGESASFSKVFRRRIPIADILNQSAPDDLKAEHQLLLAVLKSCEHIQRDLTYRGSTEDTRNRRMRDDLQSRGYDVHDQTQLGVSGPGKDVGELDLMVYREGKTPWSIIEALRTDSGAKGNWNSHLAKLLDNYNPHGVPFLFLVTYADCDKGKFDKIWESYRTHIQQQDSGKFRYVENSFAPLTGLQSNHYIQLASSQYACGSYCPTVYHIFVQMDPKNAEN